MNKQSEIYTKYLEQFKDNPKYEVIWDIDLRGATDFGQVNKIYGSGQDDGVFLLLDGRIAERVLEHGWITRFFVFRNKEDWDKYNPPMPWNIYFEY